MKTFGEVIDQLSTVAVMETGEYEGLLAGVEEAKTSEKAVTESLTQLAVIQNDTAESKKEAIAAQIAAAEAATKTAALYDSLMAKFKSLDNWLSNEYNVRDYGAVGDGVTDDYKALQGVFDTVKGAGGGTIYFPKGKYATSQLLILNVSNVKIKGAGQGLSIIYSLGFESSNRALLVINGAPVWNVGVKTRYQNIEICDLSFDMSIPYANAKEMRSEKGSPYVGSIMAWAIDNLYIHHVTCYKTCNAGVGTYGCYNVMIDHVSIQYLRSVQNKLGNATVEGGNAIEAVPIGWSANYIPYLPDELGSVIISNCHVNGNDVYPSPLWENGGTTGCNIGIMAMAGGPNVDKWQIDPIIISNCTIERCNAGLIIEGMREGGTGGAIVSNNTIEYCITGAHLMPDCPGDLGHNSRELLFIGNRVHDILLSGVSTSGEEVMITNNIITDWGLLTTEMVPFIPTNNYIGGSSGVSIRPGTPQNTTAGTFKNAIISHNTITLRKGHSKTTYYHAPCGIYVDAPMLDKKYTNIIIDHNTIDGRETSWGDWPGSGAGILMWGNIEGIDILNNIICGWPSCGIRSSRVNDNPLDFAPRMVRIKGNKFYDMAMGSISGMVAYAVVLSAGGMYYEMEGNWVYQVNGTNLGGLLRLVDPTNPLDCLIIKDNRSFNLKPNKPFLELAVTPPRMVNEGNINWDAFVPVTPLVVE